ncbi:unnamed protein product [Spirodela intermedia]|uniref:Uncharacterized protein n=1 Tax=Spirodela intermedia TaxID=51605 RepID=A0A7I8JHT1_SPIIN|nr:unnamed protein product [Spirodela intermedia]CAA6669660.1 unnamed protein product [Spirodela intermedia]
MRRSGAVAAVAAVHSAVARRHCQPRPRALPHCRSRHSSRHSQVKTPSSGPRPRDSPCPAPPPSPPSGETGWSPLAAEKAPTPRHARRTAALTRRRRREKESGKELSKILREEAAIGGVERKAITSTSTHRLWPKAVLGALDDAVSNNQWESALQIFGLLRKQKWYNPKGRTFARLMMMLGRCGQPRHAGSLFQIMLSEGLRPTPDVYTALEALALIDEMKSLPTCHPDVYTYTIFIDCLCKQRRFDLIPRALAEMKQLGISPNVVTHNIIIDGYGKAKMLEEMESSLSEMIACEGCLPDECTLNSILWAYGDCGLIQEMERSFDEFQHMGVEPDVTTFNILIRSYGRAGLQAKMCLVMDFMKKRFFSPTTRTLTSPWTRPSFNCVINAYGEAGEVEIMEEMFLFMREKHCKPDSVTLATMIQAYRGAGMLQVAENLDTRLLELDKQFRQGACLKRGPPSDATGEISRW